jgi:hypothetical protein
MSLHIKERFKESFLPALASRAGVDTLCKNAHFRKSVSKQGKCHDTFEKVHFLACCRLQKLVEATPQAPISISDRI